jgi:hypothetical protein
MTDTNEKQATSQSPVAARAATYYRMTRYIMVVVLFGYGLWSIRDGFYRYPQENAAAKAAGKDILPHPGLDVPFNQVFGIVLPPLAIVMLCYCLYKSRGEIRLDGQTLSAPGHPPVSLDAITAVDQRLWDRKGIAFVEYELPDRKGRITLDDFIYERPPIDEIHKRITDYLAASNESDQSSPESAG